MSMSQKKQPTYKDGRTKQSFKDETDINKLLKRAQKTGTISHLNKHEAQYGDFAGFDFFNSQLMLAKGREIFDDLPSELRNEFNNSQRDFFNYVNDPENKDRLGELLPALAEPGRQNISTNSAKADAEAAEAAANEPQASINTTASGETSSAKKTPEAATEPDTAPTVPST